MIRNLWVFLLITTLASCGTNTHIVESWREPGVTVDTSNIHQFVVAALMKNQTVRHRVEDEIAAQFPGKAVQSYKELGEGALNEDDSIQNNQKLKNDGFDGIAMMRLVNVDKTEHYVPGAFPMYYHTWWGYWRYSWAGFYDPGYYTTDKTYDVEVTIYSLRRNKLIWAANTSTVNPPGKGELFSEVAKVVVKRMKKEGFLK
ncbi:MAG TPA: hypothetical protein VHC96_22885 [Puia sp.]|jgi:hypothetical protein|nr:hypothetical protein [Puia sp.]